MKHRRFTALAISMFFALLAVMAAQTPSQAKVPQAGPYSLISGSGSSWSANAVQQWISDVTASGIKVVFTSSGSAQGRKDFSLATTDFGVSDIGFQGVDSSTGQDDTSSRPYAYLPIVAGGTSFPYHLTVAGQLVNNLRLSGTTLAKIFTNAISNWNDPAITKDNNGRQFPSLPIIPVVHQEGSGSTAQFTNYLAKQYASIWAPFNSGSDAFTEYFPRQGAQQALNGSDGVNNFITASSGNGAIGYDEYSYPLASGYPVAKLENAAGFYTLPTQYNVAVALTQAKINTDKTSPNYLLQDLTGVYTFNDPRTYALSSYSYMIIPTSASDSTMTTPKRQALADYLYYSICQGQSEMGKIGYSPLPVNLVQASFDQIAQLKSADPGVDLTNENVASCNNPTFVAGNPTENHLADIDPAPLTCDQDGQGPCSGPGNSGTVSPTTTAAGTGAASTSKGAATTAAAGSTKSTAAASKTGTTPGKAAAATAGTAAATGTTAVAGTSGSSGTSSVAAGASSVGVATGTAGAAATTVDPNTGAVVAADTGAAVSAGDGTDSSGTAAGGASAIDSVTTANLASSPSSSLNSTLGPLAALELLALVFIPPLLIRNLRKRSGAK